MTDWQPIETAPEEREVLVRLANGQITNARQLRGFPNNDETYWRTMTGMVHSPHHWMPLPTPPTEGGES